MVDSHMKVLGRKIYRRSKDAASIPGGYLHANLLGLQDLLLFFHPVCPEDLISRELGESIIPTEGREALANYVAREKFRISLMEMILEMDSQHLLRAVEALEPFKTFREVFDDEGDEDEGFDEPWQPRIEVYRGLRRRPRRERVC